MSLVSIPGSYQGPLVEQVIDSLLGASVYHFKKREIPSAIKRVLAEYDRDNSAVMTMADGGRTGVSNTVPPAGFVRTVIREALCDLNVLELVNVLTDPTATATTAIPYEVRKPGTIVNDGIVYEGRGIPCASIQQKMELAYVVKIALSLVISNECLVIGTPLDFDVLARNIESNARIARELVARRIANELQRAADAFGAVEQSGEDISGQLAGAASLIKTAHWPIVRPKQVRDLQGNEIGDPECPITVTLNAATLSEWDGSGAQPAGTYWRVENCNLGFIRLVDETGEPATPTATSTTTISYWSATNCSKFDLKLPSGVELPDHLDGALRAIGARKSILNADRFVVPDFLLMSPVLNDILTNARSFVFSSQRAGSGLNGTGDLEGVKGTPAYSTNLQSDLKDDRILMGQRGTLSYVIAKPWANSKEIELIDPETRTPSGQKALYGEEFSCICVPKALRNRLTSIIVYDSDARAAAS